MLREEPGRCSSTDRSTSVFEHPRDHARGMLLGHSGPDVVRREDQARRFQSYDVRAIYVDSYQMHRSISALAKAGALVIEFPQTPANTTRMGQVLFDLVRGRNLVLYPDPDLRQQALHTVAIETGRGFRIAKEKASNKIDAIVALSMACVAALDQPEGSRQPTPEEEAEDLRSLRAFEHRMGWPLTPWRGWQNYVGDGLSDPDSDYQSDHGRWFL